MDDQGTLALPEQEEWTRPKAKHGCRRDTQAGPGTCFHWWDGCPSAEKRGCYLVWFARKCIRETNDAKARSFLNGLGIAP